MKRPDFGASDGSPPATPAGMMDAPSDSSPSGGADPADNAPVMAGDAGAEDGDSDAAFQTAAAGKPTRTKPSRPVLPPLTSDEIAQLETNLKHPNVEAFLSLIAHSEGATYNSLLNGPHGQQNTFDDYSRYPGYDHPKGSASGRYQILRKTYDDLSPRLGVRDFSPHTQDLLAAQLLTQKGAMQPLLKGDLDAALAAAAPTWRSLPSGRDQPGYDQQPYVPYDQARTLFDLYRSP